MLIKRNMPPVPDDINQYILQANYDLNPTWQSQTDVIGFTSITSLEQLIQQAQSVSGTDIILQPNMIYQFSGYVDISPYSIMPSIGTIIKGQSLILDRIISDTTGSTINFSINNPDKTFIINNLFLSNTSASGSCITFEGTNANINTQFCALIGPNGLIANTCNSVVWENASITTTSTSGSGFQFNGSISTILGSVLSFINTTASGSNGIYFNSGTNGIISSINNSTFFLGNSSTTGIKMHSASYLDLARANNNSFRNSSGGVPTSGFSYVSPNWIFNGNENLTGSFVKDSSIHLASNYYDTSPTIHTVSSSTAFQKINDPNMINYLAERVSVLTGSQKNEFKYTGTLSRDCQIVLNVTPNMVSPGAVRLGFGFTKNSELLSSSVVLINCNRDSFGSPPVTITTAITFDKDDVIAPVIRNYTNTTSVEIYSMQIVFEGDY